MTMKLLELAQGMTERGDHFLKEKGAEDFHRFAFELLNQKDLSEYFDLGELIKTYFNTQFTSKPNFNQFDFSDLPLTIARGESCFIDLYFWRRRATVIHNHHFKGAFSCLLGKNVDYKYNFKSNKKLTQFHETGILEIEEKRVIFPGDSVEINFLDDFIHQNHHHADLTVNLCFRTPDIGKENLSNFLLSGFRFEKNPQHLSRLYHLRKFLDFQRLNLDEIKLGLDDCLSFMILFYSSQTNNKILKNVFDWMNSKIKRETNLDIPKMLEFHDKEMDKIENNYD
jgi:hypothetical protein